jgi:3-phenylpropionate/trans-cinnamate dioxygenase ferredoxin reductase component
MGTDPVFRSVENGANPDAVDVLIVGGGHAGAQAAIVLRNLKFAGTIAIATEEPELPYERPPLSKDYLAGAKTFDRLLLRPPAFWVERAVQISTGQRIVAIDTARKQARTEDGRTINYGTLIWAAGGRARQLTVPGAEFPGVHIVRSRADIDAITARLDRVQNVVVAGGGYIGLEAASVLRKLHKSVTLVEMQARLLSRVAGKEIAEFYADVHRQQGVVIHTNVAIERIEGDSQCGVSGVRLSSGELLPADLVIVGIGIVPNIEPLAAAGAVTTNGVHVDELCRTSIPDIYAVGDCAAHVNAFAGGERIRLECVQNANEQATCVAKTLTGQPTAYIGVPWFWSDQYDLKLQMVGLSLGHDTTVVRGDPASRSFAVAYLKRGQLIALDCVNATRDYVQGRKLITDGVHPDLAALADASIPLKDVRCELKQP